MRIFTRVGKREMKMAAMPSKPVTLNLFQGHFASYAYALNGAIDAETSSA
jgi:hypothetical protein